MKKIILLTSIVTLAVFTLTLHFGCTKSSKTTAAVDSVDPTNADKLQAILIIPNGVNKTSSLPSASSTNAPVLSGYQTSAAINPNHQLVLPFNYKSSSGVSKVCVQVQGATGYIEVTSASSADSGTILLPITIPGQVKYGIFTLYYLIIDNAGNVSSFVITTITINAPVTCATANVYGAEGLTFTNVDMTGKSAGTITLNYDTYSVPDRIDVYQAGTWLTGTGTDPHSTIPPQCDCSSVLPGFIGATGTLTFPFDPNKSKDVTVVVSGCLGGGTAWEWHMVCP